MRKIILSLLFLTFSAQISADGFSGTNQQNTDFLFGWAESSFSDAFPSQQKSMEAGEWYYRYYPSTATALGYNLTSSANNNGNGDIYIYGENFGGLVKITTLNALLPQALATISYTKFTSDFLNGKTFYWVVYDDFGYEDIGKKWQLAKLEFTGSSSLTFTEINTSDSTTHSIEYTIDSDGVLIVDPEDEGGDKIKLLSEKSNFLTLCHDYGCLGNNETDRSYYYTDLQEATNFANAKNAIQ